MVKVRVTTYGSVGKAADWDSRKLLSFEQEKVTVENVLKAIKLKDGRLLFDLVADENGIKTGYTVLLNGVVLQNCKDLRMELKSEDVVTALDLFRMAIGG